MDNTHQIEPRQPFYVDSRPLAEYDPARNYGEIEYADPTDPSEVVAWGDYREGGDPVELYDPATGARVGSCRMLRGRASASVSGAVLATERAQSMLRGEPWAVSCLDDGPLEATPGPNLTVVLGAEAWREAAIRYPAEAIVGVGAGGWTPELRRALGAKLPAGWSLQVCGEIAGLVLS